MTAWKDWTRFSPARNACGKVAFGSRKQARQARKKQGLRAYRCPDCGLWHLGHNPEPVRRGDVTAAEHYGDRNLGEATSTILREATQ